MDADAMRAISHRPTSKTPRRSCVVIEQCANNNPEISVPIQQADVDAVKKQIRRVVESDYSDEVFESAQGELETILSTSKEGTHVLPEILEALNSKNAHRAIKLIRRRMGSYTGTERVAIAVVIGSVLALLLATVGLWLIPPSARVAQTILCEPLEDSKSANQSGPQHDTPKHDKLEIGPMYCPSQSAKRNGPDADQSGQPAKRNAPTTGQSHISEAIGEASGNETTTPSPMSLLSVVFSLFAIYWMPCVLLGYLLMWLYIRRKSSDVPSTLT